MSKFLLFLIAIVLSFISCKSTETIKKLQNEIAIIQENLEISDLENERYIQQDKVKEAHFKVKMHDTLVRYPSVEYQELLPIYEEVSGFRKHKDIETIAEILRELRMQKRVFESYIELIDEDILLYLDELKFKEDSLGKRDLVLEMLPFRKKLLQFDKESGRSKLIMELQAKQDELDDMDEKSGRVKTKELLNLKISRLSRLLDEELESN